MKKLIFYLPLCILIAGLVCQCLSAYNRRGQYLQETRTKERYFGEINEIIKDSEFDTAKEEAGKIVLYNGNLEQTALIAFDGEEEPQKFIYAYKNKGKLYFVTYKEGNDERGVMFVNDGSDNMMNGLWSAERINGNAYKFDTMIKY